MKVSMTRTVPIAPPFDLELRMVLDVVSQSIPSTLSIEDLPALRGPGFTPSLDELLARGDLTHQELWIPSSSGTSELLLSVFRRKNSRVGGPGFFFTHVGGMIFGDRFVGVSTIIDYVELLDATVVTVEYRLAPENPAPAAVDDSYAALVRTSAHAEELGFDPTQLIAVGASAGGGLAAGITLRARDQEGPQLAGQMLLYPMLDVRNESGSSHQIDGIGVWDRNSNDMGWNASLGARRATDDVTPYESPSLAQDLSGLPPTYLEVGSAEVFRDETVAYASGIWAAAGVAELHVWPGGYHLFELLAPDAVLSRASRATRQAWVLRNFTG